MRSLHQPTDCPQVTGLQPGQASLVCPPPSLEDDVFAPPEEEEREQEDMAVDLSPVNRSARPLPLNFRGKSFMGFLAAPSSSRSRVVFSVGWSVGRSV